MAVRSPYMRSKRFKGFRMDPTKDHVLSVTDEQEHSRLRTIMIHGVRIIAYPTHPLLDMVC